MPYPWSAGNVLTATDLNSSLAAKTDLAMTQNAQTGTSYSYALADASKLLSMSNAASNTVLVTKQATITWVTGTQLRVVNLGAGVTTLVADTGVTINGNVALKQYQGGTLIRTASDVWLFVPTASSSGMDLITPTSVAGTGVTLSGGQVTFSAAATVSANGCFTTAYDNYMIVHDLVASTSSWLHMKMRLSGTDNSASTYYDMYMYAGGGAAVSAQRLAQSDGVRVQYAYSVGSISMGGKIDVFAPALARATSFISGGASDGTGITTRYQTGLHNTATAFDGFTITPVSGGSLTGTLRIYGLRNS